MYGYQEPHTMRDWKPMIRRDYHETSKKYSCWINLKWFFSSIFLFSLLLVSRSFFRYLYNFFFYFGKCYRKRLHETSENSLWIKFKYFFFFHFGGKLVTRRDQTKLKKIFLAYKIGKSFSERMGSVSAKEAPGQQIPLGSIQVQKCVVSLNYFSILPSLPRSLIIALLHWLIKVHHCICQSTLKLYILILYDNFANLGQRSQCKM